MEKIRIGVIGCGLWGRAHMLVYSRHPRTILTAVCDREASKAEAAAAEFAPAKCYTDYRRMLDEDVIDAVSIVTPDFAHTAPAIDCASAGKHLLIEKPLATEREDLPRIYRAIKDAGVRAMVDLHNRWSPPFAATKAEIERGNLGEIVSLYFRLNDRIHVPTQMLPWAAESSILWFLGSHAVDTLRWLTGDEIETVYAVRHDGVLAKRGVDSPDVYQTVLRFARGAIATMENSWILPNTFPCVNDIKFNATGTKGLINLDLSNSQLIERYTETVGDRPDVLVNHFIHGEPKGFAYESIRHFADCLSTGADFLVSLKDAIRVSEIILAIMESAETGMPVKVQYADYTG